MKEYGEQIDPSTHRKNYVRVVSRNGESSELDLQGIRIDSDISGTLKFAVSYRCAVSSCFLGVIGIPWHRMGDGCGSGVAYL
jgi:hypothetical protein